MRFKKWRINSDQLDNVNQKSVIYNFIQIDGLFQLKIGISEVTDIIETIFKIPKIQIFLIL
jgi:hypothetical protein